MGVQVGVHVRVFMSTKLWEPGSSQLGASRSQPVALYLNLLKIVGVSSLLIKLCASHKYLYLKIFEML